MTPHQAGIRHAEALMMAGNTPAAIEVLRDLLTAAPEDPFLHLMLSRALRAERRLTGARYEAEQAISLAPMLHAAHAELAVVLLMQQRRREALAAAETAVMLDPGDAYAHLLRAKLLRLLGRRAAAERSLETAAALEPGATDILAERGYAALEAGRMADVEEAARTILSIDPTVPEGLVLMGHVLLTRNEVAEARSLALAALARAPMDIDALHLLASAKMKGNVFGALWWRWNRLLVALGQARTIFFIVGIWLVYRWLVMASGDLGLPPVAELALTGAYLVFVVYTISAGAVVRHMLKKELESVRLKPGF